MPSDVMRRALLHDVRPHLFPRMARGYTEHTHTLAQALFALQGTHEVAQVCLTGYYDVSPVGASKEHNASIFGVAQFHFDAEDMASAPLKHWCYLPDYTAS